MTNDQIPMTKNRKLQKLVIGDFFSVLSVSPWLKKLLRDSHRIPNEQFGDLNRVRGGAFAEVVADAPECEAVVARQVFSDAADEHGVVAVAIARLWVLAVRQVIDHFDAREVFE